MEDYFLNEVQSILSICKVKDIIAFGLVTCYGCWKLHHELFAPTKLPVQLSPLKYQTFPISAAAANEAAGLDPTTVGATITTPTPTSNTNSPAYLDCTSNTNSSNVNSQRGSFSINHSFHTTLSKLCYIERVPGIPQIPPAQNSLLEKFWRHVALQVDFHHKRLYRERCPKRIILVRHGESQANIDDTLYSRVPDNAIELTERGHAQV